MVWTIKYSDTALNQLKKLDKGTAKEIVDYLDKKIAVLDDPTLAGKAVTGILSNFWRYRVRDMRIICHIDKNEIVVLVLRIAHRRKVYDDEKQIGLKATNDVRDGKHDGKMDPKEMRRRAEAIRKTAQCIKQCGCPTLKFEINLRISRNFHKHPSLLPA